MVQVLAPPVVDAQLEPRPRSVRKTVAIPALVGLIAFAVSAAGSWQPSYWGDEAASVMSAERSLPSLFRMLGHVDAVHGTYYLFLHYWIDVFGTSEVATRLPSALAVGFAAAGIVVLCRLLVNLRVAVMAGLVFAVLPRVTYMGEETRSTAMATAVTLWLTVLLVQAIRTQPEHHRRRLGLWLGYELVLAAGTYVFLYLLLLIPVHALAVLLLGTRLRSLGPWFAATAGGVLLALPVLIWGVRQHKQISFIGHRPEVGVFDAAVNQWFGSVPLALAAWALVLLAVAAAFVGRRVSARPAPVTSSGGATGGATGAADASGTTGLGTTVAVMLAWMLIPSAALLIGTRLIIPMYSLRYLSICTPAVAVVLAIGIASIRLRWLQASALLLIIVLAMPQYFAQRGEYGKNDGSDWRQVAAIVRVAAEPGDAVVFDDTVRPSRRTRLALRMYPRSFAGLDDVTLERPFQSNTGLWDTVQPLTKVTARLASAPAVWLLQFRGSTQNKDRTDLRTLQKLGFTLARETTVNRTTIIEMTR